MSEVLTRAHQSLLHSGMMSRMTHENIIVKNLDFKGILLNIYALVILTTLSVCWNKRQKILVIFLSSLIFVVIWCILS